MEELGWWNIKVTGYDCGRLRVIVIVVFIIPTESADVAGAGRMRQQ